MVDVRVFDQCLILTGPTGSGKSALAVSLAERFAAEIISMDSMAVYRGMNIGTAKPDPEILERVPHHLIDCLYPWEGASVAWWLSEAERITRQILARRRLPIIVGGTPLYLKALMCGLFEGASVDLELRKKLESLSNVELMLQLRSVDAVAADRIHVNDHKRLVRALEVCTQTGKPFSSFQQQFDAEPRQRPFPILCLDVPRDILYQRINTRVDSMMQAGWLDEVKQLLASPRQLSREAAQAAGYRELIDFLQHGGNLDVTVAAIKTRTRQLAKRQLTWFRHFPGIEMVVPASADARATTYISSMMPAMGSLGSPL